MKKTQILLLFILCSMAISAQTVNTQFGQIQGNLSGSVYQFLGIPFAKPPVDSLRWKEPRNPDAWAGILNTTSFAPVCPQMKFVQGQTEGTYEGSEDCLYLNVWTPQLTTANLPVLVFIHGGGNQQGGATETGGGTQMYKGNNMAQRGIAVIVTIQYRLGPLGFLVHPGLEPENANNSSGNYAVLDQILALKWVQNNIANFGGDPTKVMIFGESAGGVNVGNLLTTPLAAGLFQRACIQSATPVIGIYNDAKTKGISYVNEYTTSGSDTDKIAHMRTLSADSLVKSQTSPLSGGAVQMNWQAVVDNVVFNNTAMQTIQNGMHNKVPLLLGSNADEMSLSAPQTVTPLQTTLLVNASLPAALQSTGHTLYPSGTSNADARTSYVGVLTDMQFTSTCRRTASCISLNQTEPVWRYFFSYKSPLTQLAALGSYHGLELFYIFNTWENTTTATGILFRPQDDSLQVNMLKYWVNFAATGNPNGANLVTWPQYSAATDCYLELKATPNGSQCGLRTAECNLWDNAVSFSGCSTSLGLARTQTESPLLAYPNPSKGLVFIKPPTQTDFTLSLYNLNGSKLLSGKNRYQINLADFPAGIYTLIVNQDGKLLVEKIVKE